MKIVGNKNSHDVYKMGCVLIPKYCFPIPLQEMSTDLNKKHIFLKSYETVVFKIKINRKKQNVVTSYLKSIFELFFEVVTIGKLIDYIFNLSDQPKKYQKDHLVFIFPYYLKLQKTK